MGIPTTMEPIKIFYCCTNTPKDKELRDQLEIHLMSLKRLSRITLCLTREILAGTNYKQERDERLHKADLILLLVSPDFVASNYHYSIEMSNALEKYEAGNVWVTSIILRPTSLVEDHFGKLQMLPSNGKAITLHENLDSAFVDVVKKIGEIVYALLTRKYGSTLFASTQSSTITCETCNVRNSSMAGICKNCSDLLLTDAQVASFPENGLRCPNCGFENRPGAKFCKQDGQPLSQNAQKLISDVTSQQKKQQSTLKNNPLATPSPEVIQLYGDMIWASDRHVSLGYLVRTPFLPAKDLVYNGRSFTNDSQVIHVLLEIKLTEPKVLVRRPLNLALVLDHSGSMRGAKLKNIKDAAKLVIDRLEPTDYVSVIIFDDTSHPIIPSMPANDKPGMKGAIDDHIQDAGGSTMSLGMIQGLSELRRWNIPNAINRMILLADGVTYGDSDRCHQLARDAAATEISIYPFGIGFDWDKDMLDTIGYLSGGGPAEFLQNPNDVLTIFQDQPVMRLVDVAILNAGLELYLPVGVTLKKAIKVLPLMSDIDLSRCGDRPISISMGDMEKDKQQLVLLELLVNRRLAGFFRIAQAKLYYGVPMIMNMTTYQSLREDIIVTFTNDIDQVMQINAQVTDCIKKVKW